MVGNKLHQCRHGRLRFRDVIDDLFSLSLSLSKGLTMQKMVVVRGMLDFRNEKQFGREGKFVET